MRCHAHPHTCRTPPCRRPLLMAMQREWLGEVRPVHDDILLAKLAPGQKLTLEAWAHKGIGRDHAKFSPVATAAYRMLPHISIKPEGEFLGQEADDLVAACPANVFDIEDLAGTCAPPPRRPRAWLAAPCLAASPAPTAPAWRWRACRWVTAC
jgi:hypothetical protein